MAAVLAIGTILLAGCAGTSYSLLLPREPPPDAVRWSADFARDELLVHVEGARPPGRGPFPTVLVLPVEDEKAASMRGVMWELAVRGYVAIAADYERRIDGAYRPNWFAWRSAGDLALLLDATRAYPEVDQDRIGALGFSEGAVVGLLMAAHHPDRIKTVVAYYPITDFPHWYAGTRSGLSARVDFVLGQWKMRSESGASDDEDFQRRLRLASPIYMADVFRTPVLLVHGAEDDVVPPEESERMRERLQASGVETALMIVPGAGRLFNFRDAQQAAPACRATLDWLDRHLRRTPAVR
jgi:dipeptidyl aminopeptidase/acylaminoacyl peptidase